QFDVEGDTLGLVAQYRSDHRVEADKALAWYSDGRFEQAIQDYAPQTNRGQLYLLHPFPAAASPEGQDWSVTFSVQDGAWMDYRTFTAHTSGESAASPGTVDAQAASGVLGKAAVSDGPASALAAESVAGAPTVTDVYVSGTAWTQAF